MERVRSSQKGWLFIKTLTNFCLCFSGRTITGTSTLHVIICFCFTKIQYFVSACAVFAGFGMWWDLKASQWVSSSKIELQIWGCIYSFSLEYVAMIPSKCSFPSWEIEAFLGKLRVGMHSFTGKAGKLLGEEKKTLSFSYLFMLFVASHRNFSQYVA